MAFLSDKLGLAVVSSQLWLLLISLADGSCLWQSKPPVVGKF